MRPSPSARLAAVTFRLPPVAPWRADERLRGILLQLAATVLFSSSDATSKFVTERLPLTEVAWVRYLVFALAALAVARHQGMDVVVTRRPLRQAARGAAVVTSALLFLMGLGRLPLADAAAINFVSPLLITALAVPVLGETVGLRRWIALGVGLGGAVLAAQPGTAAFQPAAIFPLLSALTWAVAMVLTRSFAGTERPTTTVVWTACTGLALLTVLLPFDVRVPSWPDFGLCLFIGVVASGGQSLMVLAYRLAPASLLAPFSYMQLIWSTTLSYIVFGARPSLPTLAGAVLIAGSGLYAAGRGRTRP